MRTDERLADVLEELPEKIETEEWVELTGADLAAYRARPVTPLQLTWRGCTVRTPPPTAGGSPPRR